MGSIWYRLATICCFAKPNCYYQLDQFSGQLTLRPARWRCRCSGRAAPCYFYTARVDGRGPETGQCLRAGAYDQHRTNEYRVAVLSPDTSTSFYASFVRDPRKTTPLLAYELTAAGREIGRWR